VQTKQVSFANISILSLFQEKNLNPKYCSHKIVYFSNDHILSIFWSLK